MDSLQNLDQHDQQSLVSIKSPMELVTEPVVPAGFTLVPTIPTILQIEAIRRIAPWSHGTEGLIYKALIESGPTTSACGRDLATIPNIPVGYKLIPTSEEMTDCQGEAVAQVGRCCGGIAYSICCEVLKYTVSPTSP